MDRHGCCVALQDPVEAVAKEVEEAAAPSTCPTQDSDVVQPQGNGKFEKPAGTAAKAFKRVNEDEWLGKKGSWDNSYVGTFGKDGWGYKAQEALGKVRGKDFTHEKNKKKRGGYRGGKIEMGSNSIKFDNSDDE